MTAYNVVRFRVKAGNEAAFEEGQRRLSHHEIDGFRKGALIKTGDRSYCFIGEWESFDQLATARPKLIGNLDGFRHMLEDLGGGLGVTDPVSGPVVVDMGRPGFPE